MKKCTFLWMGIAISGLCAAQTPVSSAPVAEAAATAPQLVGQVISRKAIYQAVAVPGSACSTAPVAVQAPNTGAGAMVGAIAGAVLGSQIGGGQGQALATMAGMMGGAVLGNNAEASAPPQIVNATTCNSQSATENRLIGFEVVYEYMGKQYTAHLPQDPGATIALQISPAGMAMPPTPPSSIAPTALQPQVVYTQPAVVYGAPYYYNPYPFSVNFGWGYRGGFGRRWR